MREQTDSQLLEQFRKQKSDRAFEILVERYMPMVHAVCSRILTDAGANDAAQAVFVALALKADGASAETGLAAWLHRTSRAVSGDVAREHERRRVRQIARFGTAEIASRTQRHDARLERLDAAVEALPTPLSQAIVRHYMLGWPILRIAAADETSPLAVNLILSRAKERLRRALALESDEAVTSLLARTRPAYVETAAPTAADVLRSLQSASGEATEPVNIAHSALRRWAIWRMAKDSAAAVGVGAVIGAITAFVIPTLPNGGEGAKAEAPKEAISYAAAPIPEAPAARVSIKDPPLIYAAKTCGSGADELWEFKQALDGVSGPVDQIRDHVERTPLHWATLSRRKETVLLLLLRGSSVNAKDVLGKTPLTYAVEMEQEELLLQYLLLGGSPNVIAVDQSTPLAWAALHDKAELCEILLWMGADIHPRGVKGPWEPIEAARRGGGQKVGELFKRYASQERQHSGGLSIGAAGDGRRAVTEILRSLGGFL